MNFGSPQSSEATCSHSKSGLSAETVLAAGFVAGCATHRTKAGKLAMMLSLGGLLWRFWKKDKPSSARPVEPFALPEWTETGRHVVDAELLPIQPARAPLIHNFPLSELRMVQEPASEPAPPLARKTIADYLRPAFTEVIAPEIPPPTRALHGESLARFTPEAEPTVATPRMEEVLAEDVGFDPFHAFEPLQAREPTPGSEPAQSVENGDISWLFTNKASLGEELRTLAQEPPSTTAVESQPQALAPSLAEVAPPTVTISDVQLDVPPAMPEAAALAPAPQLVDNAVVVEERIETPVAEPEPIAMDAAVSVALPPPPAPLSHATVPQMIEPVIERLAAHSPTQPLENWTDVLQGLRKKLGPQVQPPRAPATTALSNDPEVTEPAPSLLGSIQLAPATTPVASPPPATPTYSVDAVAGAAWLLGIEPIPVIHQDVAWPQPLLAGVHTSPHRPATASLSNGGAIPDVVEIPDVKATVHPAIERAFAKLDASSPMTPFQPIPAPESAPASASSAKPATTKGLLGKIFAAETSAKPRTTPLTTPQVAPQEPIAAPASAASTQQPSWITTELRGARRRMTADETATNHSPKPATMPTEAATPQPITSSPRRIVPRAPATLSSDESKRKGMLSWWK